MTSPFRKATGRGLKIAVIDSGVNLDHPHISARTHGIRMCEPAGDFSFEDMLGHGTAVMAAIQEKAPEASYHAVKLFGHSLRASSTDLLRALEWAVRSRMDIVNLSLGTPNMDFREDFELLVEHAAAAGTILVCARGENERPVLPGLLHGVVSVDVDWEVPRDRYRVVHPESDRPHFAASGFPRSLPGLSPSRNLHGVSFAVANMTGFVARACETLGSTVFKSVCEALAQEHTRLQSTLTVALL